MYQMWLDMDLNTFSRPDSSNSRWKASNRTWPCAHWMIAACSGSIIFAELTRTVPSNPNHIAVMCIGYLCPSGCAAHSWPDQPMAGAKPNPFGQSYAKESLKLATSSRGKQKSVRKQHMCTMESWNWQFRPWRKSTQQWIYTCSPWPSTSCWKAWHTHQTALRSQHMRFLRVETPMPNLDSWSCPR